MKSDFQIKILAYQVALLNRVSFILRGILISIHLFFN